MKNNDDRVNNKIANATIMHLTILHYWLPEQWIFYSFFLYTLLSQHKCLKYLMEKDARSEHKGIRSVIVEAHPQVDQFLQW